MPEARADSVDCVQAAPEPEEPKFLAFVGSGRRLDGKPAAGGPPVPVQAGAFGPRLPTPAPGAPLECLATTLLSPRVRPTSPF